MTPKRTFVLKKELFRIPKGHIFYSTYDGKEIYPYYTDYQGDNDCGYRLYYPIKLVEESPDWFEEITKENDFVKQVKGTYKFVLPENLKLPDGFEREVTKDGLVVGRVTNVDLDTGMGTIEIYPEQAYEIWKEIAGPWVGVSSREEYENKSLKESKSLKEIMDEFLFQKNEFDIVGNPPTESNINVDFLDVDIDDIIKDV